MMTSLPICVVCLQRVNPAERVALGRDGRGARVLRHYHDCSADVTNLGTPLPVEPIVETLPTMRPSRPAEVPVGSHPYATTHPALVVLDTKVKVLKLWHELIGRKLTPAELEELFFDRRVITMVGRKEIDAREAVNICRSNRRVLSIESWGGDTRVAEKERDRAQRASLELVLDGRNEKYAHYPQRPVRNSRTGSIQNYNDPT